MVDGSFLRGYELDFLIDIGLSLLAGFLIGAERESRGKAAGISQCLEMSRCYWNEMVAMWLLTLNLTS